MCPAIDADSPAPGQVVGARRSGVLTTGGSPLAVLGAELRGRPSTHALSMPASLQPNGRTVAGLLVLALVAALAGAPILLVVWNSVNLAGPGKPVLLGLDAWTTALSTPTLVAAMTSSVLLSVTRVAIGTIIAILFAWLIARTNMPGRALVEILLWLAFFLPALPATLGWLLLLDPVTGLVNQWFQTLPFARGPLLNVYSFWGIVWVHLTLTVVPAMVILITPAFRLFDASIEESARVFGASEWCILTRITLPLVSPAIVSAMLLALLRGMESFEVEQVLGTPAGLYVFPTAIYMQIRAEPPNWATACALGTILLVVLLVILGGVRRGVGDGPGGALGEHGLTAGRCDLGRWRWLAFAGCLAFAVVGSCVPLGMLLIGTFMKLYGFFNIHEPYTLLHWQRILNDPLLVKGARNSLILATGASIIGTLTMAALAHALTRRHIGSGRAIELMAWLPWCVPGMLLGLGLLWAFLSNPLLRLAYGSMAGLILAMVIKDMPLALVLLRAAVSQLSPELDQAAAVEGAGWLRTFRAIVLPLIAPAVASVLILMFVAAMRDVSTVILLATPETAPLSLLVLQYAGSGSVELAATLGAAASAIVIVVAVTGRWFGLRGIVA